MPSMTPEQARRSRRQALRSAVDTAAVCTGIDPGAFFREDGEQQIVWQARRADAVRVCAGCPVRAACEELALRDGDGRPDVDDMVRGGLTGPALAAARGRHSARLTAAVAADRDTEGRRLDELTAQLQRVAVKNPDKTGGHRGASRAQAAQNEEVRSLADQIRSIRTARRARAGWRTAA
ncbi:WhiB family transcriptional regulator [Streptomyces griseoaurantiacus]|uniref:WhiB family transcriptional regulator n=1 Tax=Streptomyces griseoaurantiacus TaxID=68213 RepID=UPI0034611211